MFNYFWVDSIEGDLADPALLFIFFSYYSLVLFVFVIYIVFFSYYSLVLFVFVIFIAESLFKNSSFLSSILSDYYIF